ncbi:Mediator of RNA polymerase II transcription subunit 16 [Nymphaea thermarum]|nr:Mediator of RNA polymerase II transcription subunit 16 [Nymphaea thermarum]
MGIGLVNRFMSSRPQPNTFELPSLVEVHLGSVDFVLVRVPQVSLNGVIAMLDADFHSLPSVLHRQQHGPTLICAAVMQAKFISFTSLDRIKCRLLEGTVGQEVRALVLDMQARLLLDMLGKGIESALVHPESLITEPWHASSETLSSLDSEAMTVEPALIASIQYTSDDGDSKSWFNILLDQSERKQLPRLIGAVQRSTDSNAMKSQSISSSKGLEEINMSTRPASGAAKLEENQSNRVVQSISSAKNLDELPTRPPRFGFGNVGQGYTSEEVKVLFLILVDLCKRTAGLQHPLPASQVGTSNIQVSLHYIDGNYTVLPEVVEASLGPHMQDQNMPRPRGADAAGLLLRELELHPPSEEWHKRNMFGGPWSDLDESSLLNQAVNIPNALGNPIDISASHDHYHSSGSQGLWPRKRRLSERDAAFGLRTSVGLGGYLGVIGSRRDVVTAVWKTGLEGVWYKSPRRILRLSKSSPPERRQPPPDRRQLPPPTRCRRRPSHVKPTPLLPSLDSRPSPVAIAHLHCCHRPTPVRRLTSPSALCTSHVTRSSPAPSAGYRLLQ